MEKNVIETEKKVNNNKTLNTLKKDINSLESYRVIFKEKLLKLKIIQIIIISVFIMLMLLSLFLLTNKPQSILYTFLGIIVLFVCVFIYSKFSRKRKFTIVEDYVNEYREFERNIIFSACEIDNIKYDIFYKINNNEINEKNIFVNDSIFETNNLVEGCYKDKIFKTYSLVAYKNKTKMYFCGKLFQIKLKQRYEGKIVCEICKENKLDISYDGIRKNNLVNLENADIYSSNHIDEISLNRIFDKKMKTILDDIKINENIKNFCFIVDDDNLYVLMNTSNSLVDINYKDPIDIKSFTLLKEYFNTVFKIVDLL